MCLFELFRQHKTKYAEILLANVHEGKYNSPMQKRIFIWFVLIVVIPSGIIYFLINQFFLNYSVNRQIENNTQLIDEMRKNLDTKLTSYQQLTMQFYLNQQAMEEIESPEAIIDCEAINNQLSSFVNANRLIVSAYLFTDKGAAYSGHGLQNMDQILSSYQDELAEKSGRIHWSSVYELTSNYGLSDSYFFGMRHIRKEQQPTATLFLGFNSIFFQDFFQDTPFSKDISISIYTSQGNFITSNTSTLSPEQQVTSLYTAQDISTFTSSPEVYSGKDDDGNEELVLHSKSRASDWIILLSLSPEDISKDLVFIKNIFYVSLALYFLFFFYLSYIISRKLSSPLKNLTQAINKVGDKTVDIKVEENHIQEIRQLSMSFNAMTHRIENLLEEVKEEEMEKRKAYMQTLQLQLTPHFLYNSLNTIRWLANINGQENIQITSKALISYLKSLSDIESEYIPLQKEIQLLEDYATIQRFRYKDFSLSYDIAQNVKELFIHKFMIINLVENSIIHGFNEKEGTGEIMVTAFRQQNRLHIRIKDNGIGFPAPIDTQTSRKGPKTLKDMHMLKLKRREGQEEEAYQFSGHSGIRNIENRLQLYHGQNYSMDIVSTPGQGCSIFITIPIMTETSH